MKTQRTHTQHRVVSITSFTAIALLGLGLGAAPLAAQSPVTWGSHRQNTPMSVRLATSESDAFGLGQYLGKPVRGANQEPLGTIADFLIVAATGQVQFAIVPSGGGAAGETFRLLPLTALDPAAGGDGLAVRLNQDQWNKVGTVTQAELPARLTMSTEHLQRLAGQFTVTGFAAPDVGAKGELVRASAFKGQALRSGNDTVGAVEDVAIDVRRQKAAAVVKSAGGYLANQQRFLVPFEQLQTADGGARLTTTLGRNEFGQAQSGPTGLGGAPFMQAQAGAGQHPAHAAVQQAVTQAAGANVQVQPEMRLVLRGTVDNDYKRIDAERAAMLAAPGVRIENQIEVRR